MFAKIARIDYDKDNQVGVCTAYKIIFCNEGVVVNLQS